jgi:hypothetical protein
VLIMFTLGSQYAIRPPAFLSTLFLLKNYSSFYAESS